MTTTALVVDDSRAMRMLLQRLVQSLGFDAVQAGHGQEALEVLEVNQDCTVALVDWNMPVMNGLDLVKSLRAQRRYDRMKIVMVTSEASPRNIYEAMKAGADEYAMKPVTADVLSDKFHLMGVHVPADLESAV